MGGGERLDDIDETQLGAQPGTRTFAGGRYLVRRLLGEGGQKTVYLVHDTALERDCALSLIKTDLLAPEELTRIRREAQLIARLGAQPHIVTVFDIGEEQGRPYIVCEYVAGGDLRRELRQAGGPLPAERALGIALDIGRGLSIAHKRGIVHRDVKPANVWLTEDGTAKLGDFGLALAIDRSSRLTMVGTITGTAAYMAPEQALGSEVDARSDLYSLGCILYEMACGRPPFAGDEPLAVVSQHIYAQPAPPSERNPDVPFALERLILQLLSKDKEARPSSADETVALLNAAGQAAGLSKGRAPPREVVSTPAAAPAVGPPGRPPPSPPPALGGRWRRNWPVWRLALLGAVSAALVAGAVVGAAIAFFGGGNGDKQVAAVKPTQGATASATPAQSPTALSPFAITAPAAPEAIAYVGTDGNVWAIKPDGTGTQQLTTHGEAAQPAWSPDGRLLAYVRRRGDAPEIWIVNVSTRQDQLALGAISDESSGQTKFGSIRSPSWEADGKALLYHEQRGDAATGRVRRHVLNPADVTANRDTTVVDAARLTSDPQRHWLLGGGFDLSARGDQLTFEVCDSDLSSGGCGIFTMPSQGAGAPASVVPIVAGEFYGLPALSPDAGQIAYYAYPGTPQSFLEVVTITSLARQRLTEAYPTTISQDPFWPKIAWSPDGRQVVYETLESGTRRQLLMVQDVAGGQPRQLAEGRHPAWAQ